MKRSVKQVRRVIALATFLSAVALGVAFADTLSEFQSAASQEGCASIPYTTLRSECNSTQAKVNQWCKGDMGEISCKSIGALSGIRSNIAGIQSKLKSLQTSRKDLERKLSSTSDATLKKSIQTEIGNIDKSIADLEGKIEALEAQAEKDRAVITKRIEVAQACVQHRKSVQALFQEAATKASAETDDEVEALAEQLVAQWEEERDSHLIAIRNYEGAVATCQGKL